MKKLLLIYNYFLYRRRATNEHGVHSPFVFDLLTNVIYDKKDYFIYHSIESMRNYLLHNNKEIECIDLGAGSSSTNDKRTVKQLTKYSAKAPKYAQLLFRLVNHFQPENILELGTSLGISTAYIAKANTSAKVITIEGCEEIATIAKQNFIQLEINNVEQVIGNFDNILPVVLNKINKVDFVFFDGNHRKDATLNYYNQCLQKATNESVFIFDDINWSAEMKDAWQHIKNNNQVTVTIDLFFMGIVFFRKEQAKQHFLLRF